MRGATVVLMLIGVVAGRRSSCPAKDNTKEGWSKGTEILSECKDVSSDCSKCTEKCDNDNYTHWMEKNCAKTCGLCNNRSVPSSGTICWKYCQGYSSMDILETVDYTSMKDCSDRCLDNSQCGGVHVTKYYELPKYCMLAKSGASLSSQTYYFGATRDCLEDNPGDNCDDHWGSCSCYSGACTSSCPYWKRLMSSVCMDTCGFCTDEEEQEEEEEEEEEGGHDDHECTWKIISGKKAKGKALKSGMSLDEAKAYCAEQGDGCAGLSCKGKKKCSAVASLNKKKSSAKFDIYQKD